MFAGVVRTAAVVGRCHAHQVSVRAFPAVMGGVSAVGGVSATQCGVGAVRGVVTVRIRNTSLVSYKRAVKSFNKRTRREGIEKSIQKNRYYIKPNVKRRLNARNASYFQQRKAIVDEYAKLVTAGKIFTIPKHGF